MRIPAVLLATLMAACGGATASSNGSTAPSTAKEDSAALAMEQPEPAASEPAGAGEQEVPPASLDPDWWLDKSCPDGATFQGSGPPEGRKAWCARPDGTKHGPYTMWFPNGERGLEGVYSDGELHGPWTRWYPGGAQLEQVGHYRSGRHHGSWRRYHDNGQLASEGSYDDGGFEHGTWSYWDADGNAERVEQWRNGELVEGGD